MRLLSGVAILHTYVVAGPISPATPALHAPTLNALQSLFTTACDVLAMGSHRGADSHMTGISAPRSYLSTSDHGQELGGVVIVGAHDHVASMPWPYIVRQIYNRRKEIHEPFGGQRQSGIVTPKNVPGIFLFTGHGGSAIGYQDIFQPDGSFRYTGQGQVGDMIMASGNSAIRDHATAGKDLLLFEQIKKGGLVRFLGLFACAGWDTERQPDLNGVERDAIVFTLAPVRETDLEAQDLVNYPAPAVDFATLRTRAMAASAPAQAKQAASAATLYARSQSVRDYVLARAEGACERCGKPAPFKTATGRPYLEAHHIRRLSDGGPDDPRCVAGICPNCHRQSHFAADRLALNADLQRKVTAREATISLRLRK